METTPQIPDHELLRRIGKGAYGEVWLARNVTGAYRAVKIVYRSSFDHDRPYEREFSGMQRYEPVSRTHETQVAILHVGRNDADGYFYYIMEVADDRLTGQEINPDKYEPWTLRGYLHQNGRLPIEECLDIGIHLASALDHIHKNGLVHRDVKPSNIIFIKQVPKLADIGLVSATNAERSFVGTEGYIPPEGPGSPQADIYSLGKVLYEISTGRNRLDFPELPTLLKDLPEREALVQFNEVILKACEDDPKDRYHSAEGMLADLWKLKFGKPIRSSRRNVRKPVLVFSVIAALAAAVYLGPSLRTVLSRKVPTATPGTTQNLPQPSAQSGNSVVLYQTAFGSGTFRLGPLARQDGWVSEDGKAVDAAEIVRSGLDQSLLVSGFNLEQLSSNAYGMSFSRALDVHLTTASAQHIKLSADMELSVDPDAAKFPFHTVGVGLILPDGPLTNMIWLGRTGGIYSEMMYPGHDQYTPGTPSSTGGFHELALDCDLEFHRVTCYDHDRALWSRPFVPTCDLKGARLTIAYYASKPNATTLVISNLVVTAYSGEAPQIGTPSATPAGNFASLNQPSAPLRMPESLKQNLVLWYSFDSDEPDGHVTDRSSHGNDGQATGTQWSSSGQFGGALVFSPSDTHVRVPNKDSLNPPRFTLCAWIKTSRADHFFRRIFDKGLFHTAFDLTVDGDWRWNPPTRFRGFVEFEIDKTGATRSTHSIADGRWHQIVATYDGNDKRLFVDGQLEARTHSPGASVGNNLDLMIGGFIDPSPENDDPHASFDGSLDEVMMFNRALTPAEIWQLYCLQGAGNVVGTIAPTNEDLKRGLVSLWRADGNALDSMHNNDGAINGAVAFTDGPSGKAFSFNGGHIEIPDSPTLRFSSPFSLSLWMKVPGYSSYLAAIITKGDHSWRLQRDFSGHSVLFSITGVSHSTFNGHPPVDLPATKIVDDGQWHHVAAIYSGDHQAIYIDGSLDISVPCSGFPAVDNSPVFIGLNSEGPARALNGEVSDVRIYNRALSPAEIKAAAADEQPHANVKGSTNETRNPAIIYETDFGSSAFRPGNLAGQDGWFAEGGYSEGAARIVSFKNRQRMAISGTDIEQNGIRYSVCYIKPISYHPANMSDLDVSCNLQLNPGPASSNSKYFFVFITPCDGNGNHLMAIGLVAKGDIFAQNWAKPNIVVRANETATAPHNLRINLKLAEREAAVFVDGQEFGILAFNPNANPNLGAIHISIESGDPIDSTLFVNNLIVSKRSATATVNHAAISGGDSGANGIAVLNPNGTISGIRSPNETFWLIDPEGRLIFKHHDGRVSTIFNVAAQRNGKLFFSGPFQFKPDIQHELDEL